MGTDERRLVACEEAMEQVIALGEYLSGHNAPPEVEKSLRHLAHFLQGRHAVLERAVNARRARVMTCGGVDDAE